MTVDVSNSWSFVGSNDDLRDLVGRLSAVDKYAIDTEFQRERTYFPAPGLIQMAWDGGVALVDPIACTVEPLGEIFESGRLAIAHAIDQDIEVLHHWVGNVPRNIFDTQVAAGFLGYSTPGLGTLLDDLLNVDLTKTDRLTDWTKRPLSASQLRYAAADVEHLIALYDVLQEMLQKAGRWEWALTECADIHDRGRQTFAVERAWWKLKESRQLRGRARLVAQQVAAWREERARTLDTPVRFVLPDLAVVVISQQAPATVEELRSLRSLDNRFLRNGIAEELLRVVREATELDDSILVMPQMTHVDKSSRAVANLLSAWLGQLGRALGIDPSLLGTRADIDDYLAGKEDTRLHRGWRGELLGEPLRKLVRGEAALAFGENGDLVMEERSRIPIATLASPAPHLRLVRSEDEDPPSE